MMASLAAVSPVTLALLATLFTWGVTALGAASVFLMRSLNQKLLDWLLGFAGGGGRNPAGGQPAHRRADG